MGKPKRTAGYHSGATREPKAKQGARPLFVDLSDSMTPLVVDDAEQAERLRRAMVGWSNYIARLSAVSMDRETTYLVARAYLRRGVGHTALLDWQAAVRDLTQVIAMQAGEAETNTAYLYRAQAYDGLGSDREAVDDLTRALEICEQAVARKQVARLSPGLAAHLYAYRALLYCRLDSFELAVADCDRATSLDAGCAEAYSVRGSAYRHLGQAERALSDCNRSIELAGRAVLYYRRALVHQQLGDYRQAAADLDHARGLEPTNVQFNTARDELLLLWLGSIGLAAPTKTQTAAIGQGRGGGHA